MVDNEIRVDTVVQNGVIGGIGHVQQGNLGKLVRYGQRGVLVLHMLHLEIQEILECQIFRSLYLAAVEDHGICAQFLAQPLEGHCGGHGVRVRGVVQENCDSTAIGIPDKIGQILGFVEILEVLQLFHYPSRSGVRIEDTAVGTSIAQDLAGGRVGAQCQQFYLFVTTFKDLHRFDIRFVRGGQ